MTVKHKVPFLKSTHTTLQTSGDLPGHITWSAISRAEKSKRKFSLLVQRREISAVNSKLLWSLQIVELLSHKYLYYSYVVSSLKTTSFHLSLHANASITRYTSQYYIIYALCSPHQSSFKDNAWSNIGTWKSLLRNDDSCDIAKFAIYIRGRELCKRYTECPESWDHYWKFFYFE